MLLSRKRRLESRNKCHCSSSTGKYEKPSPCAAGCKVKKPVWEIMILKIGMLRDDGREGCSTFSFLFRFCPEEVDGKASERGKQCKNTLCSLSRQEATWGKHTFPLESGQLSLFCLAAFFSLESLHLIFKLRLNILHFVSVPVETRVGKGIGDLY